MANILLKTEALDDTSEWTQNDNLTVTPDTSAMPASLGPGGGRADRLVDNDGVNSCSLTGAFKLITSDASDWLVSLFILKDTITTRFPSLYLDLQNGTRIEAFASIDTKLGVLTSVSGLGAFDAVGAVDFDSVYWRVWGRKANNNTGNNAVRV